MCTLNRGQCSNNNSNNSHNHLDETTDCGLCGVLLNLLNLKAVVLRQIDMVWKWYLKRFAYFDLFLFVISIMTGTQVLD